MIRAMPKPGAGREHINDSYDNSKNLPEVS